MILQPRLRHLAAVILLSAALSPAAASDRVETMLETVRAEPLDGTAAFFADFVDLAAVYASVGADPAGTSLAAVMKRGDARSLALFGALQRVSSGLAFLPDLATGAARWQEWLGFDFMALNWTMSLAQEPRQLRYLGLETAPRTAAIEAALQARGLVRTESDGVARFARGEDGKVDPTGRLVGYPFWGAIGGSERLALLPAALVGSRYEALTTAATVAPRLAEHPVIAAGIRAVDDTALPGALLQLILLRDDFSPDYVKALMAPGATLDEAKAALEAQAPGPLPPFRLLVLADRQSPAGEEALVALVYDSAADAAVAAATLPTRLAVYRPNRMLESVQDYLAVTVTASVVEGEGQAVTLLRLVPDPAGAIPDRPAGHRYQTLLRGLYMRDLGWLTWK